MLKKLIRYEFRATARILGVLYLALLLLALLNRLSVGFGLLQNDNFNFQTVSGILIMILYVLCAVATMLITIILIVLRFWRNLMENQGYLMHTLPVRARDHLLSKLLVSFIWMIVSALVILLSALILTTGVPDFQKLWPEIQKSVSYFFSLKGSVPFTLVTILTILVQTVAEILKFYAAMSVGQSLSEHRAAASIGLYVGFNILESVFESILLLLSGFANRTLTGDLFHPLVSVMTADGLIDYSSLAALEGCALILPVLYGVLYFFLSNYFLRKKLRLV